MSTIDNTTLVQQFFDEVVNKRNLAALGQFVSPNAINHSVPEGLPQEPGQFLGLHLDAFPDLSATVENLLMAGDKVIALVSYHGTHQGTFLGIPATGKSITITGINIFRFADGLVVEHWGLTDRITALRQLGLVPAPGQMS